MNETPPAGTRPVFEYDGKISELFGVFLKNLMLTIITLGFYRFWAITRLRREHDAPTRIAKLGAGGRHARELPHRLAKVEPPEHARLR